MFRDDCIFCKIVKRDINAKVVFEDNKIMAFDDISPKAPVHVVVIPKYHIDKLSQVPDEHVNLMGKLVLVAKKIAKDKKIEESGYRIVLNCGKDGGQEVSHLHLHLLGGRPLAWPPG